jgi:hypothetical protein
MKTLPRLLPPKTNKMLRQHIKTVLCDSFACEMQQIVYQPVILTNDSFRQKYSKDDNFIKKQC